MPAHQKKPVKLESTLVTEYRILQDKKKVGTEKVEKKTFDNNTIVFTIDAKLAYGPGVTMTQHVELTVEEESYFPRTLHIKKTVAQPDGQSFDHVIDVEMFSNVAEVTSTLRDQAGNKRLVVPTGVSIEDLGVLAYLYQTLFWYDKETGGEQRFQWLDPVAVEVHSGDIKMDPETTISVLNKKVKVSAYEIDRERIGPARVWVDAKGVIVRGEQNLFVYELVSKKIS
ncbi:MAG TPA: hypothetical protein VJS69_10455 [Candidatus Krumholzibacteria bacterium]|nr:hypothetical protein [Candidatus Krumholzibacteria bacterium]